MDPSVDVESSNWPLYEKMSFYKDEAMLLIKKKEKEMSRNNSNIKIERKKKDEETQENCNRIVRNSYEKLINEGIEIGTNKSNGIKQQEDQDKEKIKDDMQFFQPLIYYISLVTGSRKLDLRMELIAFIKSVVFNLPRPKVLLAPKIPSRFIVDDEDLSIVKCLIPYTSLVKGAKKVEMFAEIAKLINSFAFQEEEDKEEEKQFSDEDGKGKKNIYFFQYIKI